MSGMMIPTRLVAIAQALHLRHPELARGADDARRVFTRQIAEQAAFEFGPAWGTKSAGNGRPASKDAIALQTFTALYGWDSLNGTTREVNTSLDMEDITGQTFIPVIPTDHLGTARPPVERPPAVEPPPPVLGPGPTAEREAAFDRLIQQMTEDHARLQAGVAAVLAKVSVPPPAAVLPPAPIYEGTVTIFGRTLTFTMTPRA